jgi:endonuclease/exonuclease/phosphatase family metal-dependent hydrolase
MFSILSWNIGLTKEWFRFLCMGRCSSKRRTLFRIIDKIRIYDKDVVCLQEIHLDCADYLIRSLRTIYPHSVFYDDVGVCILSKYHMTLEKKYRFHKDFMATLLNCASGYIKVYLKNFNTYLYNIHLSSSYDHSEMEFANIYAKILSGLGYRTPERSNILVGDFNFYRSQYRDICEKYGIQFCEDNKDNSFNFMCNINLDYMMKINHHNGLTTFNDLPVKILKTYESDHFPITNI